jgi:hypothetical protein
MVDLSMFDDLDELDRQLAIEAYLKMTKGGTLNGRGSISIGGKQIEFEKRGDTVAKTTGQEVTVYIGDRALEFGSVEFGEVVGPQQMSVLAEPLQTPDGEVIPAGTVMVRTPTGAYEPYRPKPKRFECEIVQPDMSGLFLLKATITGMPNEDAPAGGLNGSTAWFAQKKVLYSFESLEAGCQPCYVVSGKRSLGAYFQIPLQYMDAFEVCSVEEMQGLLPLGNLVSREFSFWRDWLQQNYRASLDEGGMLLTSEGVLE